MAERRPLVVIGGEVQELPHADTLPNYGTSSVQEPELDLLRAANLIHTQRIMAQMVLQGVTP